MLLSELCFKRKFSVNFRKNLKLELAKMSFTSDFIDTARGNLYPLIASVGAKESVSDGEYTVVAEHLERVFAEFFPYANYELDLRELEGECGFVFVNTATRVELCLINNASTLNVVFRSENAEENVFINECLQNYSKLVVSARPGYFDVYLKNAKAYCKLIKSFKSDGFENSHTESFFKSTKAALFVSGKARLVAVSSYLDSGIGQADIRPIRYENGELIRENGKVFFTMSIRMQAGTYQGVFLWLPSTDSFELVGALFFDLGDGKWNAEVASCLIYNRLDARYHLWIRCASAGHVLAYSSFASDVRYGVNLIDLKPMPANDGSEKEEAFLGVAGDEDPELIYDAERKIWMMAVCRVERESKQYRYFFYESERPDRDFKFIGKGESGAETGGNIVKLDGKTYFVCGNSMTAVADYRVYEWGKFDSFENLHADYSDGGFRGWGTVFPLEMGTRKRLFWLTFDRVRMSDYNWSYGNLYCFEADASWRV